MGAVVKLPPSVDELVEKYTHLPTMEMLDAIQGERPSATVPEIIEACHRVGERLLREADALEAHGQQKWGR